MERLTRLENIKGGLTLKVESRRGALAQAAIRTVGAENVILTCNTEAHTRAAAERLGCASGQAAEIIRSSRFVFLGVKPQMLSALADVLEDALAEADALAEPDALVLPEELDAELQPASKPAQSAAAKAALINFVVFFMGAS